MNKDLGTMWALLTAGMFCFTATIILNVLAIRAELSDSWFTVIFTVGAIAAAAAMFVSAFVVAVDYIKAQLNDE